MAEHRGLVKFAVFPVQILPLAGLYASLVSQAVGVLALVLFAMATHGGLTARVVLLVPAVCLQLVFLAGVAWLLGAVGAVLRDVRELIGVALTAGMFVTPIFYLERDAPAPLRLLLAANPLTHLINMYRYALLPLEPFPIASVAIFLVWSAMSLLAGFWVFDRTRVFLADIL
jgi:lipopolysaccharide transport system permease protein